LRVTITRQMNHTLIENIVDCRREPIYSEVNQYEARKLPFSRLNNPKNAKTNL